MTASNGRTTISFNPFATACSEQRNLAAGIPLPARRQQIRLLSYDLIASYPSLSPPPKNGKWGARASRPLFPASRRKFSAITAPLYAGVDIRRFRDLTVIWIVEKSGHILCTRKIICLEKQTSRPRKPFFTPF